MPVAAPQVEPSQRKTARRPRTNGRRVAIVAALKRCMIDHGYAETTLTDLAAGAKMSVSHLLYYYASKDAVLLDLCDEVHARILADVTGYRGEPPEERIHVLVDNLFIHGAMSPEELGISRDLMALAAHRPQLQKKLFQFRREMAAYLEDLFSQTPRRPGLSAAEAAEIACALWIGLFINASYDERLKGGLARRLFRRELLAIANLDGQLAAITV